MLNIKNQDQHFVNMKWYRGDKSFARIKKNLQDLMKTKKCCQWNYNNECTAII